MNKLTRVFLGLLGMTVILVPNYATRAGGDKGDEGKALLAIEISLDSKSPLTVPVMEQKKSAIIPVKGAKTSAVKVVSWVEDSLITFEVSAVLDPLPEVRSCDNLKQLKTELISSHTGRLGETIRVSAVEKFGVAPFNVSVIGMKSGAQCMPACCCCGALNCCPKKASCIGCGDCGICCI